MNALPEDFAAFWKEMQAVADGVKLDYHRSLKNDFNLPGFVVETLSFTGVGGSTIYGWLAYPEGARRLPGFLWVPPYGRESLLPNAYGTREGYVSTSFNFFGHEAFHQEKYVMSRGYFAEGASDPETWIFRSMYQNAAIAARVLQAQIEVDEDRLGAMGMSQGGGISIWLGANCPLIKAVCADMPFLSDMQNALAGNIYRYPLKELTDYMDSIPFGRERVLNTVAYFDTMNLASVCHRPTSVSLGLKDPAVRPNQVHAVFDALPGPKELREYDWGHDWHEEMIPSNRAWFDRYL
jgi:cephalosporin-C deacetylase